MAIPNPPTVAPDPRYTPPSDMDESTLKEGVIERLPELSLDTPDPELAHNIGTAIQTGMALHEELRHIRDMNEAYWLGNQLKQEEMTTRKVRPIENREFLSIETLVPIVTSRASEPVVFADPDAEEDGRSLEKVLMGKYQDDEVDLILPIAVRHWFNYRIGILKIVLDVDTGEFQLVVTRPQRVVISPRGTSEDEVPFIAELVDETLGELLAKFSDKKDQIMQYLMLNNNGTQPGEASPIKYWEFWTNEFVAWKLGPDLILDKAKNPFYNFDDDDSNFVKKPFKPYFFLNRILSLGKSAYDDTSFSEQDKSIQDAINKLNFSTLEDLSDRGTIIGSGDGIAKEELARYRGDANEKIWIEHGDPNAVITRLQPKTINQLNMVYKQDLAARSDDIYGTHGTTRGERGPSETATGRTLLKEQDVGRTQPISRALDAMMRKVYNAEVQIMKMYWTEPHYVPYLDPTGVAQMISFSTENIPNKAKITVKPGSTLPLDKFVQRNEALELAGAGRISDKRLFERLGWAKPEEAARELMIQKKVEEGIWPPDVLYPGLEAEVQQRVIASQQQTGVGAGATVPPAPTPPGEGAIPPPAGTAPPATPPPAIPPPGL